MQTLKALQNLTLTGITIMLTLANGEALGANFSGSTFDPGKIDSGIPGFVGDDELGNVTANNTVNPLFVSWATGYINYLPTEGVLEQWQTPEQALGEVTGTSVDIVSLGELTTEQINSSVNPGEITLTFDRAIRNSEGADFAVFENGFGFADTGNLFAELAYVEVSTDGVNFARFPSISLTPDQLDPIGQINPTQVYNLAGKHINNGVVISEDEFVQTSWGTPFDLDVLAEIAQQDLVDLNNINFVRIVDIPGNGAFTDTEGNPIYDPWQTPIPGSGGFDLEAIGVINAQAVPEPSTALGILILSLSGICLGRSQRRSRS
ncbi:MAG: PEP-CTERM sorting domain-containing protein [Cyanobacteria bacterium J06592_8]